MFELKLGLVIFAKCKVPLMAKVVNNLHDENSLYTSDS